MNFTISSDQILAICALLTAIWGVWKIVKEIKKPNDDLKNEVARHTECLDKDNKRLDEVEHSTQLVLKGMLVIINHEITGNNIEKMKDTRDELQDYLINR